MDFWALLRGFTVGFCFQSFRNAGDLRANALGRGGVFDPLSCTYSIRRDSLLALICVRKGQKVLFG